MKLITRLAILVGFRHRLCLKFKVKMNFYLQLMAQRFMWGISLANLFKNMIYALIKPGDSGNMDEIIIKLEVDKKLYKPEYDEF